MKKLVNIAAALFLLCAASASLSDNLTTEDKLMLVKGQFQITMVPEVDKAAPAGRMIIKKIYSGNLVGSGVGQMISKRSKAGASVYFAIEEFTGDINGLSGRFTLIHKGFMNKGLETLDIVILEGSGDGGLKSISGSMEIIQEDNNHYYVLNYRL